MPPAAYSTITITDGTTTCTLTDGTNYALTMGGWAPQVPVRRASTLGGRPYGPVVESIRINIFGTTAAAALANLQTLMALIDQADRWYKDESVDPVLITYEPQGSELGAAVESLIFGFAGDSGPANLPMSFNDELMIYSISDVELTFVRDGVWYGEPDLTVAPMVPGPVDHPEVVSGTFAESAAHLSPVKLTIADLPDPNVFDTYDAGLLLIASSSNRLQIVDAWTMNAGAFTQDADAAREPQGSGVLVYTPVGTTQAASNTIGLSLEAGKRVGVVAALRNTTGLSTFEVQIRVSGPSGRSAALTQPYHVDASTTEPRIVVLGYALCEEDDYSSVQILATASAASGTLVFDYLGLIVMDDPTSRILAIGPISATQTISSGEESTLSIDPRELTARTPQIRLIGNLFPVTHYAVPEWWRGDAFLLSQGSTIAVSWCARTSSPGTLWRLYDSGAAPLANFGFSRRMAYLVPT